VLRSPSRLTYDKHDFPTQTLSLDLHLLVVFYAGTSLESKDKTTEIVYKSRLFYIYQESEFTFS
jgi:hypothetical protein